MVVQFNFISLFSHKFFDHTKNKLFLILFILIFITGCQRNEVIKSHGIAYLNKREKLIVINETNKNDTIKILGQPSTRGITDDNLWIYIERTKTRGTFLKLGREKLKKNNVLVIEFDKYGITKSKKFYDINNMKSIEFEKSVTESEIRKETFIYSFLSSIRQKMQIKRKKID